MICSDQFLLYLYSRYHRLSIYSTLPYFYVQLYTSTPINLSILKYDTSRSRAVQFSGASGTSAWHGQRCPWTSGLQVLVIYLLLGISMRLTWILLCNSLSKFPCNICLIVYNRSYGYKVIANSLVF